jgi:DNA-3-methyladenine glycosylase I
MPRVERRCGWAAGGDPLLQTYHDAEWGVPVHDDRKHFEFLLLEGAQAGLSWLTVLRKRPAYARAFCGFDPSAVAQFGPGRVETLARDASIIRNRRKIASAIGNARAFLAIQQEFGSFDEYAWRFVAGRPQMNRWRTQKQVPARTPESDSFSRDLRDRGFSFVGSTIIYAHMQAVGMVNDHLTTCDRYREVAKLADG